MALFSNGPATTPANAAAVAPGTVAYARGAIGVAAIGCRTASGAGKAGRT